MFLLLRYIFKKIINKKIERNICILGLDYAGKSSFLNDIRYYFNQQYNTKEEIVPTVGLNYAKVTYKKFFLTIWDLGGQKKFREIWKNYFEDIDVIVWVLDSSDKDRLMESIEEFNKLIENPKLIYCPICILANKQDKPNSLKENEVIDFFQLKKITNRNYEIILTSFEGDFEHHFGLESFLEWLINTFKNDPNIKERLLWKKSLKVALPK